MLIIFAYCCLSYDLLIGSGTSKGIIVQRFPEKDWKDTPFIDGIEWVIIIIIIVHIIFSVCIITGLQVN